ncbi:hypothetical protein HBH98_061550 [Parastagonospora nodorum]|nr:hypothetical protein HBI09_055570 [Parastagonospora nodorum]KAH4072234.1 hypothetical protein HBH50_074380 [Parastagonospora nodorum]KAH4095119.1 hypothetical protein HBH48_062650 [Parastagonospora nodorum]KAH4268292.1 hypothetical protein HBI03_055450 [Parastagonospora nodorum]KAH4278848.1 hypothetical protein HBI04_070890 [Parastagonospora nodorum]
MLTDSPGDKWTGIVLVDPPILNDYIPSKRHGWLPPNLDSRPFLGGCEDFSEFSMMNAHSAQMSDRGMLDELVHYWTQKPPPMFNPSAPTLQALSYYPLRVVAAEWVNYIAILGLSLREYELPTSMTGNLVVELEKLNINLRILQGWRRRILSTQAKMRRNLSFIRTHSDPRKPSEDWEALMEDYDFISTEISEYGKRLEAMVPLVTSAAALIESRRSLTETANVTRLTILAIIFIPLSYVAALFSMAENFGPGGSLFWVYFATALPLAGLVGLIAKPPLDFARKVWHRVRMSGVVRIFE